MIVNRIWLHHFGRGIVATPDEFGKLGALPTHPKLLDWLASRFMADGWSLKKLHRLMLHSTAYRQSSLRNPRGNELDGANSLYWHKSVQRLEAEVMRDRILMASGQLDDKMFGPAVGVKADDAGQISVSGGNRRSVYVLNRRTQPVAMLQVFDAPVMTVNCSKRTNSTVALQSLLLMNSDTILKHAKAMATRLDAEAHKFVKPENLLGVNIPVDPHLVDSPWSFGFGHFQPVAKGKVAKVAFKTFPKFVNGRWQTSDKLGSGPAGYSSLLANGGHPHGTTSRPIRRWTSPVTGKITIKGSLHHASPNGDGVRLTLHSSRLGKQGNWEVAKSSVNYSVECDVHKGDVIDTIVDERSTHTSDSFSNTFSIHFVDKANGIDRTWSSKEGFHGPIDKKHSSINSTLAQQVVYAWQLAYARNPSKDELLLAGDYLQGQLMLLSQKHQAQPVQQAIANLCQALISSNEFLYSD